MFPNNIKLFVAFQGQDSMKMISQPKDEKVLSWSQFFYEAIHPYQEMVRLKNKLRAQIRYTKLLSTFFQLELQHGRDHQDYRDKISEQLQLIEQLAQELDKFIQ